MARDLLRNVSESHLLHISKLACVVCAGIVVFCGEPARAQETEPAPASPNGSDRSRLFSVGSKVGKLFTQPLHPVVKGVASGGAIGGGIGFDYPAKGPWTRSAIALITPKRYWMGQFEGGYFSNRAEVVGYTRVRDMTRLNFFGPGPESDAANWTTFGMRDPVVGARASANIGALKIGGRVEEIWPAIQPGRNPSRPSIEQKFADANAPGLTIPSRFGRYQAFVQVTAPAAEGWALNQGGQYRITYDVFDDLRVNRFDFHRVELEGRHTLAGFLPFQTLTLHGWVSSSQARTGHQVPFFLQHTLGGTSNLRSVDEALLGGDGTTATLRGFPHFRFRDNNVLLLQAEYRFGVWGPIDASVFVDAGKAVSRRADLNLSNLKRDYGFSVSVMRGPSTVGRVDVGFGGGEGTRVFFTLGSLVP